MSGNGQNEKNLAHGHRFSVGEVWRGNVLRGDQNSKGIEEKFGKYYTYGLQFYAYIIYIINCGVKIPNSASPRVQSWI